MGAPEAAAATPAPDPVSLGKALVPTATQTVLRTTCATHPCLVCWLAARIAESGDAPGWKLVAEPLHLNIVGCRQESSISDSFDDAMVALCRVLPPDQRGEYERAVEQEIRDRLRELGHGRARLVPCTAPETKGLWLVAVYQHVTTDPGLEARRDDVYAEKVAKARKARDANEKQISDLDGKIAAKGEEKRKKEEAAGKPDKKRAAELKKLDVEIGKLERDKEKREGNREKLEKDLAQAEAKQAEMQEQRDEEGEIRTRDGGRTGWLAQGRAIVNPGVHQDEYKYFPHKWLKGHVAITVGFIYYARRLYTAGKIRTDLASWREADDERTRKNPNDKAHFQWEGDGISVAELTPFEGQEEEFAEGAARVIVRETIETLDDGSTRRANQAVLVSKDGRERALDDRDMVVVRARVGGTNLHRAHNVKLVNGRVAGEATIQGAKVGNWSEGCQTYRSPEEFDEFLRLCAVSARWRCTRQDPSRIGAHDCRILKPNPPEAEELSDGENKLEEFFGRATVAEILAERYEKQANATGVPKLKQQQKKWQAEVAKQEAAAAKGTKGADTKLAAANEQLVAIEEQLAAKQPAYDRPKAIADELRGEQRAVNETATLEGSGKGSVAEAETKARKAKVDHEKLLRPGSRAKPSQKTAAEREQLKWERLRDDRRRRLEELRARPDPGPEVRKIWREFLRERAASFGSDHLRHCHLTWTDGCAVRFTYVLIEVPSEARAQLVAESLGDKRYGAWPGDLVVGGGS
jgi:hypothetical protein